jgi:hypothetical protein
MIRPSISLKVQENNRLEKLGLPKPRVPKSSGPSIGEDTHVARLGDPKGKYFERLEGSELIWTIDYKKDMWQQI